MNESVVERSKNVSNAKNVFPVSYCGPEFDVLFLLLLSFPLGGHDYETRVMEIIKDTFTGHFKADNLRFCISRVPMKAEFNVPMVSNVDTLKRNTSACAPPMSRNLRRFTETRE